MNPEEAYELVTEALKTWKIPERAHGYDVWEIVQNSLGKRIPKKYLEIDAGYWEVDGKTCKCFTTVCPVCNTPLSKPGKFEGKEYGNKYCGICGQKIEW